MADAIVYGGGEEAKAKEEKSERELEEEGEESRNLKDFPLGHGGAAVLASTEALPGCRIVNRQVLAEPLLHEDAE